ncbi:MAG TPA: MoaD/ThiS family protein [Anaerolineaceae bacterium]|nr:MoaD/ThiS family protein [Anaerolineaceae bacterium]
MAVKMILHQKEFEVSPGITLAKALQSLELHPEMYLALHDGDLITEDEVLHDGVVITLVAVISGGAR